MGSLINSLVACLFVTMTAVSLSAGVNTAFAASSPATGNTYYPISPVRVFDSRNDGTPLTANGSLNLVVAATNYVPSTATSVVINETVANPTTDSYLTTYGMGSARPATSSLNWVSGQTVSNLAIAPVGSNGSVTFYNHQGNADLIVDLEGYFAPTSADSYYIPLTPTRIADTRPNSGSPYANDTLSGNSTLDIQVAGAGGVPSSDVAAAVLNVTAANTSSNGYLAVYPSGVGWPGTSNLNWVSGETVANRVIVPIGSNGEIAIHNWSGNTDVAVDIDGYFTTNLNASGASTFTSIAPTRVLDTRVNGGTLGTGQKIIDQIAGVNELPDNVTAAVVNLTATDTTQASYLQLSPSSLATPTSDLNWSSGQTVANLDFASLNTVGETDIYNNAGQADVVVDLSGYFTPVTLSGGVDLPPLCKSATVTVTNAPKAYTPVDVALQPTCPAQASVVYTYWYQTPDTSSWLLASRTSSATFSYGGETWGAGTYNMLVWVSTANGAYQGVAAATSATIEQHLSGNPPAPAPGRACPAIGLFVGSEAPSAVQALGTDLGVTPRVLTAYAYPEGQWNHFTFGAGSGYQLLLGVGAVTPAQATTIGDNLVSEGYSNTIIRIMWEMNGNWFPWGTQALSAAEYISIYRAAESAFAAVPGNHFTYVWNLNAGTVEPGQTEFDTYPGRAYVTSVGIDYYDHGAASESWLAPILAFAAAQGKPVSIDEWGVNRLNDPGYVNFMASVVHNPANDVTLQAYFSDGGSQITDFPLAEAAYRDDFSGGC